MQEERKYGAIQLNHCRNFAGQFLYSESQRTSSAHSPTFLSLHLSHSSFSNPSVALPTSQLILQPFCCFTHITAHSPTFPLLYLHHSSFSNLYVTSPTSQLILQPIPSLYLRHSSFSNPSVASPTSQLILLPFFRLSYVTGFHLRHLASRP